MALWENVIETPLKGRLAKPRKTGITMLIDKGLSLGETQDLLDLNSGFIDFIKLSFGTAALYPEAVLRQKIALASEYQVFLYPGGTFFEIAYWRQQTLNYFTKLVELGFKWVEISDGTLEINPDERQELILKAQSFGLNIITEVGKKNPAAQPNESELLEIAHSDLAAGVPWVIIEARESGQGIGIFDPHGGIINDKFDCFARLPQDRIIWEAPLKKQQAQLINSFGPNVNLGNIPPSEIMALEALRLGLRSDTWKVKDDSALIKI